MDGQHDQIGTMQAIWQELQDTVHAVDDMNTLTPEEAASQ